MTPPEKTPLVLVRGEATADEVAALLAALAASSSAPGRRTRPARGTLWADRSAALRAPVYPGPGGWQAAAQPR